MLSQKCGHPPSHCSSSGQQAAWTFTVRSSAVCSSQLSDTASCSRRPSAASPFSSSSSGAAVARGSSRSGLSVVSFTSDSSSSSGASSGSD